MPRLAMRFDMRRPAICRDSAAALYAAALEQSAWADEQGFETILLSEHHGTQDGYLPSPIPMAAAIAARTRRVRIRLAALVAAFHDPLRIAEDLAVLDLLSNGRIDVMIAAGYVPSEFAMFGQDMKARALLVEETVAVLKQAWTGEAFEFRGRQVRVRPVPVQKPRPPIDLGGSSPVAAKRAARIADGFFPSTPEQWAPYREEVRRLGRSDPGPCPWPGPEFVHVARDPASAWAEILPYALHEFNEYARGAAETGTATGFQFEPITDPAVLEATGIYQILTPEQCYEKLRRLHPGQIFVFHPLMSGLPVEMAWSSLRLVETEVLPALRA